MGVILFLLPVKLIRYIAALKKTHKTALLNNTQKEFFRNIVREYDLERLFDVVVSSSEVGMIKPHSEIYRRTLQKLNVRPEEMMFIDDREENVRGAEAVGIHSIRYTDFPTLRKEFDTLGIV